MMPRRMRDEIDYQMRLLANMDEEAFDELLMHNEQEMKMLSQNIKKKLEQMTYLIESYAFKKEPLKAQLKLARK